MPKFRISKFIEIDAAHRVPMHESKCKNMHGHRYKVQANVEAEVLGSGAQDGMVLDFSFLKQLLVDNVDRLCDHGTILSLNDVDMVALCTGSISSDQSCDMHTGVTGFDQYWSGDTKFGKTLVIPYSPTAENLARFFYYQLNEKVLQISDRRATLASITIWETPTSEATYPATYDSIAF